MNLIFVCLVFTLAFFAFGLAAENIYRYVKPKPSIEYLAKLTHLCRGLVLQLRGKNILAEKRPDRQGIKRRLK
jgi:hypothetical protein